MEREKKRSGESKHGRYEVAEYDLKLVGRSAVQNIGLEGELITAKNQDIQLVKHLTMDTFNKGLL